MELLICALRRRLVLESSELIASSSALVVTIEGCAIDSCFDVLLDMLGDGDSESKSESAEENFRGLALSVWKANLKGTVRLRLAPALKPVKAILLGSMW